MQTYEEIVQKSNNIKLAVLIVSALGVGTAGGAAGTSMLGSDIVITDDGRPSPALELYVNKELNSGLEEIVKEQERQSRLLRQICIATLEDPRDCDL